MNAHSKKIAGTPDALAFMKDRLAKAGRSYEDAVLAAKENSEALLKSADLTKEGFEAIRTEMVSASVVSFKQAVAATEALLAVRTAPEFFQLQTEILKNAFDTYKQQFVSLSELVQVTAKRAGAPIQSRVEAAMSVFPASA